MPPRRPHPEKVFVNVYDLSPSNDILYGIGCGFYHSGIEVCGTEYTFGSGGGIFSHSPKQETGAPLRISICIGEVSVTSREVETVVDSMRPEWPGSGYDVLTRNCNSFSEALAKQLLGNSAPYPGFINRLSYIGSFFSCLIPDNMRNAAPVDAPGTASRSSTGNRSMNTNSNTSNISSLSNSSSANTGKASTTRIFAGGAGVARNSVGGNTSSSGTVGSGVSGPPDREKLVAAALKRINANAVTATSAGTGTPGTASTLLGTNGIK